MAKQLKIVATISKDGKVEISGNGFSGKQCDKEIGFFKDALGKEISRENTSDYYKNEENQSITTKN